MRSYVPIIHHIINSIFIALATRNKKKTMYIKVKEGTHPLKVQGNKKSTSIHNSKKNKSKQSTKIR
jgi:hypothetical protein